MFQDFEPVLDSSPLLKSIFENATTNAIQVMDTGGYILHVNEPFTHEFGYTAKELYGKHCKILFTEEDRSRQLPEMEIEKVNQNFSATDRNYLVHKDTSCIWVSGESVLAKNKDGKTFIIKFIQNIHEQKLLEKFLKESTEFCESVIRSITDALIVFDTNFRIHKVNNAFYNLFDIHKDTLEGVHLFELNNDFLTSGEMKQQLEKVVESESPTQFQLEWKVKDVTSKHFLIKASFIDGKMVNKRILLVLTDVSDKVQSEQKRDDLIAFVIHELRNPLANISLCNTLLEQAVEENDKESADEYISKSKASTNRLKLLIQELYDATKAGSGNLQFSKSQFNIQDLVKEVIENVQLAHEEHVIGMEGEADVNVFADRERIQQALSNFLLNAIKYSPGQTKVEVQLSVEMGSVVVAVADYGQGISEEKIPYLFERYYRADETKKIEGLGLGLFLTKQIIDAHNGRVWVKSKVNEGSTFYFSIPL